MSVRRPAAGFTLAELLVAAAITLGLGALALGLAVHALEHWRRWEGEAIAETNGRLALDVLARDVQGALHRADGGTWLAAAILNSPDELADRHGWRVNSVPPGRIKPAGASSVRAMVTGPIAYGRFGLGGAWLRWFTLDHAGLPTAVSYQICRLPLGPSADIPDAPRYVFVRRANDQVLDRGTDLSSGYSDLEVPAVADILAGDVVDFGVRLFVRDRDAPDGLRQVYPRADDDPAGYLATGRGVAATGNVFPEVGDFMLRVLTTEGADLVANLESGRGRSTRADDDEWWRVVERNSVVQVRRVEFKAGAP